MLADLVGEGCAEVEVEVVGVGTNVEVRTEESVEVAETRDSGGNENEGSVKDSSVRTVGDGSGADGSGDQLG